MFKHPGYRMSTHCKLRMCEHSGYIMITHCKHRMFSQHNLNMLGSTLFFFSTLMTSLIHYHTYSLAHKTNHSFIPNCEFGEFLHPRFGLVPSILAIHDIGAGEEIFVWYGYDLDYCPQWYMDAWAKGRYYVLLIACRLIQS